MKEYNITKEFLLDATTNLINGLNAVSLDLNLLYKFLDMCENGWYDEAYELMFDIDLNINDSDRASLKYLFFHAKEDYNRIQDILDVQ